jgi:hypothetical protein
LAVAVAQFVHTLSGRKAQVDVEILSDLTFEIGRAQRTIGVASTLGDAGAEVVAVYVPTERTGCTVVNAPKFSVGCGAGLTGRAVADDHHAFGPIPISATICIPGCTLLTFGTILGKRVAIDGTGAAVGLHDE